ncbi:restriction endonuclease subunit S [Kaistia sp. MMO-174]|uniref:restriction endonuclease subunit S n=1 Tax=Kaistia sp. MMO-174 TaxID=3081256 RepID=UPI00301687D3
MMNDWNTVELGELAAVYDGPHATPKLTTSGPIFLGIDTLQNGRLALDNTRHVSDEDFKTWTRRVTPQPGDLVFSYETRLGEAALIPERLTCCLGRRMGLLRPKPDRVDSHFLLYRYLSPDFQTFLRSRTIHGATVDRLPLKQFPSFPITLPDLDEQRRIAAPLMQLDDKIELNRRMIGTLEAMAQAIFRDWFVDFGPVRRKMEGTTEPVAVLGGVTGDPTLAAELAGFFPAHLEQEGEPAGWTWGTAENLIEFNPSIPLKKGTIAPYLEMAALPTTGPTADAAVERQFGSGMRFANGDALLARITPCLENGKACFVDSLPEGAVGWGSTEFFVLRAKPPCPPPMGYLLCRDPDFQTLAVQSMTGTSGRQRAQLDMLRAWPLAIPPDTVLRAFGTFVEPLFAKITAAAAENRTLAEARDYLLPRLMSGEIRVTAAPGGTDESRGDGRQHSWRSESDIHGQAPPMA